jgi:hypothetical protein
VRQEQTDKPHRQRRLVNGRKRQVLVRLSEDDYQKIVARAAVEGLTEARLLAEAGLGDRAGLIERRAAHTMFLGVRRQLVGMATNLNQLAHVANSTGRMPVGLDEALAAVMAMQAAVEEAVAAAVEAGVQATEERPGGRA